MKLKDDYLQAIVEPILTYGIERLQFSKEKKIETVDIDYLRRACKT